MKPVRVKIVFFIWFFLRHAKLLKPHRSMLSPAIPGLKDKKGYLESIHGGIRSVGVD